MPVITLPDGTQKRFDDPIAMAEIAQHIGAGLAKAAIAGKVDDQLVDLAYCVDHDARVTLITSKSPEALEILRHSTAHLLAQAVKQLFPEVKLAIGPAIDDGFYYDFESKDTFTVADLDKIDKMMRELVHSDIAVRRQEVTKEEAVKLFQQRGEPYKVELIEAIADSERVSLYWQGDFVDLCRGPHVASTGKLSAFKLTKVAGAYWKGDSQNKMLQRIYGTAWFTQKDLDTYLKRLEEAEKRDHRKIGKHMDLFHFDQRSPGMVFWHDKGWRIYQAVVRYMRELIRDNDYQEVSTPIILERSLWEQSGHWDKFREIMFTTQSEDKIFAIKPMNCPGNIQIFNQGLKSYRDLPLRMAEFGICHRNELSGALHGLMRIRSFMQDDAHVFCLESQMLEEIATLIDHVYKVYRDFGFDRVTVRLATRPERRIGSDENWDKAEKALEMALNHHHLDFELAKGEGAFYGPKIEFHLHDCLDRVWQCGTIQVDFSLPERFHVQYVDERGERKTVVMIHRAIVGSIERFIGILLEQYSGKLPLWLSPVPVVVMNITDNQAAYVVELVKKLKKHNIFAISDLRNEKIGFKIREHTLGNVPYLAIVGDREVESGSMAVRTQSGVDLGSISVEVFIERLKTEIAERKQVV